jgi:hypothetical protein
MHPLMAAALTANESTDAVLDREAAKYARRWGLIADDGSTRCRKCSERADPRMLHCGQCLVALYRHNHPGSEWQLWPALERILRAGHLDQLASESLVAAASEVPHARADWLNLFRNIVRGRFAPDPDDDWRTR